MTAKTFLLLARLSPLWLAVACQSPRPAPNMDIGTNALSRVLHEEVASGRTPGLQYRHFTRDSVVFAYDADTARVCTLAW